MEIVYDDDGLRRERRMLQQISRLRDHIIVCGYGVKGQAAIATAAPMSMYSVLWSRCAAPPVTATVASAIVSKHR